MTLAGGVRDDGATKSATDEKLKQSVRQPALPLGDWNWMQPYLEDSGQKSENSLRESPTASTAGFLQM